MLGQAIYGDGIYYWGYVRSVVLDGDLKLFNEASHQYSPHGNNSSYEPSPAQKSLVDNKYYPIGPSVMWSPGFLLAHILSGPLNLMTNGYADQYQIAVGILNVFFVIIGIVLLYNLLIRTYASFVSFMTILLVLFGTNLLYYGSIDILNSHPSSFLISVLLITLLFKLKEHFSIRLFFISGIILGLLTLIRPQDGLFGILFSPFFVSRNLQLYLKRLGVFVSGMIFGYLPQFITSYLLFNTFFAFPYLTFSHQAFHFSNPHIFELLFSTDRGIVFFSPIYLIGIVGLILYMKKNKDFGIRFVLLFILTLLLISVWSGWNQGEAFGLRMFISLLPLFAFGISEIVKLLTNKISKTAMILIVCVFVLQNFLMIFLFHLFLHNPTFINGELTNGGRLREEIFRLLRFIIPN